MAQVEMPDLKPNSHRYRDEQKSIETREKLEPIVKKGSGRIASTKKPLSRKLADNFIKDDIKDVGSYLWKDVIFPGIINTALNMISMTFLGEMVNPSRGYRSDNRNDRYRTNYTASYRGSNYTSRDSDYRRSERPRYRGGNKVDYRNIVLLNREDAEEIVYRLRWLIDSEYHEATVADLLELIDEDPEFIDSEWGWTRCSDIGVRKVVGGYLVDVAEAKYLGG